MERLVSAATAHGLNDRVTVALHRERSGPTSKPGSTWIFVLAAALPGALFPGAALPQVSTAKSPAQTQADSYTRYELLAPDSHSFRIVYDVSATTAGATYYFNPIRAGSKPTVHGVTDLASGKQLEWQLVSGKQAANDGLAGASPEGEYIRVALTRPVPKLDLDERSVSPSAGEARLRIDKTYADRESYSGSEDRLSFQRSLGIQRNSVVLPRSFELTSCNYPAQIDREVDGRIRLSFIHRGPGAVPLEVRGRKLSSSRMATSSEKAGASGDASASEKVGDGRTAVPDGALVTAPPSTREVTTGARTEFRFRQRANQDREIVYFLEQPETHSFRLYHDYTETRPGVDRYLNIVRAGSKASRPQAWNLDSGEPLRIETLTGQAITEREIDIGQEILADTEVIVIWFEAVKPGGSIRLRIEETYTDPGRYGVHQGELLWDRSFGRARNAVVLPVGWSLASSSIPATVATTDDDRLRLEFVNDRPGNIDVHVRARRK